MPSFRQEAQADEALLGLMLVIGVLLGVLIAMVLVPAVSVKPSLLDENVAKALLEQSSGLKGIELVNPTGAQVEYIETLKARSGDKEFLVFCTFKPVTCHLALNQAPAMVTPSGSQ